jgi:hypothetical protein
MQYNSIIVTADADCINNRAVVSHWQKRVMCISMGKQHTPRKPFQIDLL